MKDKCLKAYAYDKFIRIYAASSTELVEEARKLHNSWPTSTAALGRFLTASAITSLMYKSNEYLTFIINGHGEIGEMVVEACNGKVKGSIQNPSVYDKYDNGHLAVGRAVGNQGELTVIKDLHMKDPFISYSPLQTGEIGDDFTYYFATSEQIPSAVGVGVLIDTDNTVKASGGFILQVLNGCPNEVLDKLEEKLRNLKPVSKMIEEGYTPLDMIKELSDGNFEILEEDEIKYECDCSKERFALKLESLGEKELTDIIEKEGKADVMCHFCMKKYTFNKQELLQVIDSLHKHHSEIDE
jgi:molecular chaperone Hsp33